MQKTKSQHLWMKKGGSRNRILLSFSCFGSLKLNADHELMETNFWKKKSFWFIRYPYTKTSLIFATDIKVWKIQFNLCSLFFRDFKYFIFPCFSVHFSGQIRIDWRLIFKNQERFFSIMDPFTKKYLSIYTGVTIWEIWKLFWHLFSRNSLYLPGIRFAIFSKLVDLVS